MRLGSERGDLLELSIVGYQFPDAEDPLQRFSWHMIEGTARSVNEQWTFRRPALTCDESPRLGAWLRTVADAAAPLRAWFTEPNLAFEVPTHGAGVVELRIELDVDFRAPGNRSDRRAGNPTVLHISVEVDQLTAAADEWARDVARYPDLSAA